MSCFIAIEGIDGSGKGTQTAALCQHLNASGLDCQSITFPRYRQTLLGGQIGRFLDGQFGPLEHLHPVPISLMYATERYESRELIVSQLERADVLVSDRYVGSNLAHQGARLQGAERDEFLRFIEQLEYGIFRVPQPDLVILLDLPAEVSAERVALKNARDYTEQVTDLHESNLEYLQAVREVYLQLCQAQPHWHRVPCLNAAGAGRTVEAIQTDIRAIITRQCQLQNLSG